ncbi:MAG TPA: patatin-like phospholipase family protein [Steroidobacteraceae bacterium]|jgi:predicted acylesterase/phospholipase RssA
MLTIEPALQSRGTGESKTAVALAGGGPLGAFYELGVLHALSEAVEGLQLTELSVYVGVSSGSIVAAGLANGFDTTSMGEIFIHDESTLFPFSPAVLLRPAVGEYLRRARELPRALSTWLYQYVRDPLRSGWPAGVGPLGRAIPTAVFDNGPMEDFLRAVWTADGHTDDFRKLRHRLYVVATNLNTGESVHFGARGYERVPISRAVVASTALPGLYPAVEIDGQFYVDGALIRTMNASLALEDGCNFVICVNPLVPFDASHPRRGANVKVTDAGLPTVLSQTFRALIHSRMKVGMASYRSRFPTADLLLIEPDRQDDKLFFANVFRYADRRRLVDHAYQVTRRDLLRQADALEPLLRRHGMRLRIEALRDKRRSFSSARSERARERREVARRLDRALGKLERTLRQRDLTA